MISEPLIDSARFESDDPDALVWAAFACGYCLERPDLVRIESLQGHHRASTCCSHCGNAMHVLLSDEQAARLWRLPRGRVFVHFPPELW